MKFFGSFFPEIKQKIIEASPAMITLPEPEDIGSKLDNDQIINIGPDPKLNISMIRRKIFSKLKFFILTVLILC